MQDQRAGHGAGEAARANSASFFRNLDCAYFPCHTGIDPREFNCLFCYCPLYALGERCEGSYSYTSGGIKDCSNCTRLHRGDQGVALVRERFGALAQLAAQERATGAEEAGVGDVAGDKDGLSS